MTIVNTIKPLLSSSRLFFPQGDGNQDAARTSKTKAKRRRKGKAGLKDMVKLGTGGTLDPLADGVLGMCQALPSSTLSAQA
jgi:tRNA pseudouridine55 synthase